MPVEIIHFDIYFFFRFLGFVFFSLRIVTPPRPEAKPLVAAHRKELKGPGPPGGLSLSSKPPPPAEEPSVPGRGGAGHGPLQVLGGVPRRHGRRRSPVTAPRTFVRANGFLVISEQIQWFFYSLRTKGFLKAEAGICEEKSSTRSGCGRSQPTHLPKVGVRGATARPLPRPEISTGPSFGL